MSVLGLVCVKKELVCVCERDDIETMSLHVLISDFETLLLGCGLPLLLSGCGLPLLRGLLAHARPNFSGLLAYARPNFQAFWRRPGHLMKSAVTSLFPQPLLKGRHVGGARRLGSSQEVATLSRPSGRCQANLLGLLAHARPNFQAFQQVLGHQTSTPLGG